MSHVFTDITVRNGAPSEFNKRNYFKFGRQQLKTQQQSTRAGRQQALDHK
ncbi:hypothetical protein [Pseudomonas fragi]|nr:hypothetical protein [Pseudomonas fragi]NNB31337.1 hypothetical protein [Pseudomonas fragi]WRT59693.1 hypothetical protein VK847_17125 [Pseudomonas fragi]